MTGNSNPRSQQGVAKGHDLTKVERSRVTEVHAIVKSGNLESFITRQAEISLRELLGDKQHYVLALHGSSKQGKSNILRSIFSHDVLALHLELGYEPTPIAIYKALLNSARAVVRKTRSESTSNVWEIGKIFVWKNEIKGGDAMEFVDGEFDDVTWVAKALLDASPARVLVLDNFHHVDLDGQKKLSRDFTVLGAKGFKVVVAGTWKQADYLRALNNDLRDAYQSVSVDPWTPAELEKVVAAGAKALGYAMPEEAKRTLASVSRGSIGALQSITARYYLDQIKGDRRYKNVSEATKANTAAQLVAGQAADDMASTLVSISDYGSRDATGRHHVSYVVEAILSSTPDEVRRGFSIEQLKARVDSATRAWALKQKRPVELMSPQDFARKVKVDWMKHQIVENNTPFVVYDKQLDRVTINDSMLVFLHSLVSALLRDKFLRILRERPLEVGT
ncbi:MAG TPA: hypothetical protein VG943_00380 [Caulobacterales bacterium]|nr:hypothetical protein [Caulobacterales bacterium]